MTWTEFFLICFAVGLMFSVVSLLAGNLHLHWPHFHVHVGVRVGRGGAGPVNIGTIAAFLAWFGGTGYLLSRYSSMWIVLALGAAVLFGLIGASIVFLFLAGVLTRHDEVLDPADYDMVGVLGTVSSGIRESGTGEVTFSQAGSRRATAARSDSGRSTDSRRAPKVVVTRYDARESLMYG